MFGKKKFVFAVLLAALLVGVSGCGLYGGLSSVIDEVSEVLAGTETADSLTESGVTDRTGRPAEAGGAEDAGSTAESAPAKDTDLAAGSGSAQTGSVSTAEPYAYQTLTQEEQVVYSEIVSAFTSRAEEMQISTTDPAVLEQAYQAVRYDHCEFFWVAEFAYVTYTRGDVITSIEIRPGYAMTAEEQEALQSQVDAEADRMLSGVPADGSDFDKALYVFETLVREVDYDVSAPDCQTILSAFLDHATVCQGYSYATQYLLERLGIPCTTVTGTADGESHAWNLVLLDGAYYYIDTTWGNSQFVNRNDLGIEEIIPYKYVNYDYFGVTTEMLFRTHQPDGYIPLPVCEATADNYYVHKGLYFDTWDPDRIGEIFRQGYQNGEQIVRVRFSDSGLYEQALQYFLDDGNLFRWCDGLQTARYLENPGSNVLVVVFP